MILDVSVESVWTDKQMCLGLLHWPDNVKSQSKICMIDMWLRYVQSQKLGELSRRQSVRLRVAEARTRFECVWDKDRDTTDMSLPFHSIMFPFWNSSKYSWLFISYQRVSGPCIAEEQRSHLWLIAQLLAGEILPWRTRFSQTTRFLQSTFLMHISVEGTHVSTLTHFRRTSLISHVPCPARRLHLCLQT